MQFSEDSENVKREHENVLINMNMQIKCAKRNTSLTWIPFFRLQDDDEKAID